MEGIIIIIIISVVLSQLKKQRLEQAKRGKSGETAQDLRKRIENNSSTGKASPNTYNRPNRNVTNTSANIPPEMSRVNNPSAPAYGETKKTSSAKPSNAKAANVPKEEIVQREGESTTEFLNRKAAADQLEHKKEQMAQKKEAVRVYGEMNYAQRWMEGDPVPNGMWIVKCGYCGAENLIGMRGRKYNCYFCREEL